MASQIEFTGVHEPIGDGVSFQALVDGQPVACIVTGYALESLEPHAWLEEATARFERNRTRLREVAKTLIMDGRMKDRVVMINSAELRRTRQCVALKRNAREP